MLKITILFLVCMAAITAAKVYLSIEEGTAAVLYGGFIIVYSSVLVVIIGKQNETEAAYERNLREKKMVIYQDLVDNLLNFNVEEEKENKNDSVKSARNMTRSLITWG